MNPFSLPHIVEAALLEDLGPGDATSPLIIPPQRPGRAHFKARAEMVLSGLNAAREVLRQINPELDFKPLAAEGDRLAAGSKIASVKGSALSILQAERVALNFLMCLSGVATLTAEYVKAAANPHVRVVDTRKTTPGLRILEKAAVRHGGGTNHRFALYDGILIKDNHIAAAGSITRAVAAVRAGAAHGLKIEVEVDTLEQLSEALEVRADIVMLDNMGPPELRRAVKMTREHPNQAVRQTLLEASGASIWIPSGRWPKPGST